MKSLDGCPYAPEGKNEGFPDCKARSLLTVQCITSSSLLSATRIKLWKVQRFIYIASACKMISELIIRLGKREIGSLLVVPVLKNSELTS